jgi:hypothetical protein
MDNALHLKDGVTGRGRRWLRRHHDTAGSYALRRHQQVDMIPVCMPQLPTDQLCSSCFCGVEQGLQPFWQLLGQLSIPPTLRIQPDRACKAAQDQQMSTVQHATDQSMRCCGPRPCPWAQSGPYHRHRSAGPATGRAAESCAALGGGPTQHAATLQAHAALRWSCCRPTWHPALAAGSVLQGKAANGEQAEEQGMALNYSGRCSCQQSCSDIVNSVPCCNTLQQEHRADLPIG